MTRVERINLRYRMRLGAIKDGYQWTDDELAEAIGCSRQTLCNIRQSAVGSKYTAIIEELYEEMLCKLNTK